MFDILLPLKKAIIYLVVLLLIFSPLSAIGFSSRTFAAGEGEVTATAAESVGLTAEANNVVAIGIAANTGDAAAADGTVRADAAAASAGGNATMLRTHIGTAAPASTGLSDIEQLDIPELQSAKSDAQSTLIEKRRELDLAWLAAKQEEGAAADTGSGESNASESVSVGSAPKSENTGNSSTDSSAGSLTALGTFKLTAYCPCYECSKGWGRMTSSGKTAQPHHTIATDPSVIPEGTRVVINGETYVAEDIGSGVSGNHIDIFYESHSAALDFGIRYAEVYRID